MLLLREDVKEAAAASSAKDIFILCAVCVCVCSASLSKSVCVCVCLRLSCLSLGKCNIAVIKYKKKIIIKFYHIRFPPIIQTKNKNKKAI